jgi:XTP/dITP diphosphohydrolase
LILASRNAHKLRELREILPGIDVDPLPDEVELPPEDGETYVENALIKARAAHEATGQPAFGDDSGIEAAALGGRPGVRSARYDGPDATDESNLAKLLREVGEAGDDRRVVYRCVIALVTADGEERTFEGSCSGTLIEEPRGEGGFGYDPAFVPDDIGPEDRRTMAELTPDEKNSVSHRARAARAMAEYLEGRG